MGVGYARVVGYFYKVSADKISKIPLPKKETKRKEEEEGKKKKKAVAGSQDVMQGLSTCPNPNPKGCPGSDNLFLEMFHGPLPST